MNSILRKRKCPRLYESKRKVHCIRVKDIVCKQAFLKSRRKYLLFFEHPIIYSGNLGFQIENMIVCSLETINFDKRHCIENQGKKTLNLCCKSYIFLCVLFHEAIHGKWFSVYYTGKTDIGRIGYINYRRYSS